MFCCVLLCLNEMYCSKGSEVDVPHVQRLPAFQGLILDVILSNQYRIESIVVVSFATGQIFGILACPFRRRLLIAPLCFAYYIVSSSRTAFSVCREIFRMFAGCRIVFG